jgi:peptidoglycan/xylan/chitin deacetylase (PgdA/CDA1 family)
MKSLRDAVLRPLINRIPFSFLQRTGSSKLVIVYYHVVNDEDVPHISHLYKYKRTLQFVEDLEFLLRQYAPIGLPDLIHQSKKMDPFPAPCFLLTFDDGLREIYDVISPILEEKGIPATVFISSAFLDNRELFYKHKAGLLSEKIRKGISPGAEREVREILEKMGFSFSQLSEGVLKVDYRRKESLDRIAEVLQVDFKRYLKEKQPYLTSSQIKELMDRGFTIGAHSIDHPYYSTLSPAEQLEQTIGSVRKIREIFRLDYGAFAFPQTDAGVSLEMLQKAHESGVIDITFGTGGIADGGVRGHRARVSMEKPLLSARELLAWHYARKLYTHWGGESNNVKGIIK